MLIFQASQKYNEAFLGAVYILRLRENFSVKSRTRSFFSSFRSLLPIVCVSRGGGAGVRAGEVFVLKQNHQLVVLEI